MARKNKLVVPGSSSILEKLRNEVAAELGYPDYANTDKGDIPARVHGAIGGTITKKLIALGEQALAQSAGNMNTQQTTINVQEYKNEMEQSLQQ